MWIHFGSLYNIKLMKCDGLSRTELYSSQLWRDRNETTDYKASIQCGLFILFSQIFLFPIIPLTLECRGNL